MVMYHREPRLPPHHLHRLGHRSRRSRRHCGHRHDRRLLSQLLPHGEVSARAPRHLHRPADPAIAGLAACVCCAAQGFSFSTSGSLVQAPSFSIPGLRLTQRRLRSSLTFLSSRLTRGVKSCASARGTSCTHFHPLRSILFSPVSPCRCSLSSPLCHSYSS